MDGWRKEDGCHRGGREMPVLDAWGRRFGDKGGRMTEDEKGALRSLWTGGGWDGTNGGIGLKEGANGGLKWPLNGG